MHADVRTGTAECDQWTDRGARTSRLNKFALAGATVVTASALAVAPVTVTPSVTAVPNPQVASEVDLSAFENPLTLWVETISNTLITTGGLGLDFVEQVTALGDTLGTPALQREFFTSVFGTIADPVNLFRQTLSFPSTYGSRILAALQSSGGASNDAFSKLPAVLSTSIGHLLRGEFLLAFGEINMWFLTDGLSDGRGALLDALRIPGDFLESIGLDPLARILGTSWMDEGTNGPGFGAGLLSRGVIGNFGRALLAPAVTAIFQTMEILDSAREALFSGDLVTLASEVINAPAKILNAFLNGYVPAFKSDPDHPYNVPGAPGQSFPGLLSPTGTFDFFFVQIPQQIVRALKMQKPAEDPAPAAEAAARVALAEASASPADASVTDGADLVPVDLVAATTGSAPDGEAPAVTAEGEGTGEEEAPEEVPADAAPADEVPAPEEEADLEEAPVAETEDTEATETEDDDDAAASSGGDTGSSGGEGNRERRNGGDRSDG
ncbi:hypothetical protein ACAG25_01505 [Mycobacterium sp. pV006]|uniref:hypothetical protein n=1 Tax=Mycobacterium sp. pV006 TaxID=3238983 RepID=UPI00351BD047